MASYDLNILVKAKGALQAARDIGKVDSSVGRLSRTASQGVRTAARNTALIGAGIAVGVAAGVKSGIQSLADLEDATTAVQGAIVNAGIAGQVTAGQVAAWANKIEADIGAAFDDKDIVSATATLLRFGKVTPGNLQPAMQVMTDLAVKTGSVDSAASLLAKALADPEKAAGKLARTGVVLTKEQQKQIKAYMKAGDAAKAQGVILAALTETTKGAAAASQGPYRRSLAVLADVTEDAQRALGEGFLPVIEKVSALLSGELAKPSTIANIREFGKGLASGLDDLIDIARNLPWATIGDSLKLAGAGAKTILGAFSGLPPWVQTAVLTGWGLNKLSGGALGGIVGELGKGLIKGVLGMNAGVVNINAAAVNGGGVGGAAGGAGKGLAGKIGTGLAVGAAVAGVAGVVMTQQEQSTMNSGIAAGAQQNLSVFLKQNPTTEQLRSSLAAVDQGIADIRSNPLNVLVSGDALAKLEQMRGSLLQQLGTSRVGLAQQRKGEQTNDAGQRATQARIAALTGGTRQGLMEVGLKAQRAGEISAGAIRAKDLSVSVNTQFVSNVSVSVTAASIKAKQSYAQRAGKANGSYGGNYDPRL